MRASRRRRRPARAAAVRCGGHAARRVRCQHRDHMTAMLPFLVEVELVRAVEREGRLHEPKSMLRLPLDEAMAMIRTGFARPLVPLLTSGTSRRLRG